MFCVRHLYCWKKSMPCLCVCVSLCVLWGGGWVSVGMADGQDSPSGLSPLIGLLGMMLELVSTKTCTACRTHNNMYLRYCSSHRVGRLIKSYCGQILYFYLISVHAVDCWNDRGSSLTKATENCNKDYKSGMTFGKTFFFTKWEFLK